MTSSVGSLSCFRSGWDGGGGKLGGGWGIPQGRGGGNMGGRCCCSAWFSARRFSCNISLVLLDCPWRSLFTFLCIAALALWCVSILFMASAWFFMDSAWFFMASAWFFMASAWFAYEVVHVFDGLALVVLGKRGVLFAGCTACFVCSETFAGNVVSTCSLELLCCFVWFFFVIVVAVDVVGILLFLF